MSHNHFIRNLLNLKDDNVFFDDNWLTEAVFKDVLAKIVHAKLTYEPNACYHCGAVFDQEIIKYGFKTSLIKMPENSGFNTYLSLKKQRYYCRHCNSTFTLKTPIVAKNCFISTNTKLSIAIGVKDKISEKDLAKRYNVSHCTVSRIIDQAFHTYRPSFDWLPDNLCFDEFKSVKAASGAMSFIFCDADTGAILDIVEDRRLPVLERYFSRYSQRARQSVKRIVIDMYSPYMTLIKKLFPKAKIIIDKFHIVQLFNRALNKTRIQMMKHDDKNYSKLKKYWKLILSDNSRVDSTRYRYHHSFKRYMTQYQILEYLLDQNKELKATHDFYQNIMFCVKTNNYDLLETQLAASNSHVSDYMKTAICTIKKHKSFIKNTLSCNYTNGVLEGLNNKIKVIKRIAFGYKSFFHFRNRILITQGILKMKTA